MLGGVVGTAMSAAMKIIRPQGTIERQGATRSGQGPILSEAVERVCQGSL